MTIRDRMLCALGAAVVALVPAWALADDQAPPTLTPAVANTVAAACPGTRTYADALVRGITRAAADAAAPRFAACAKQIRLFENQWKNDVASLALGAVELSRGLLENDSALLRHAVDATAVLRSETRFSDAEVRAWQFIPDSVDADDGSPIQNCARSSLYVNAAYVNVAARAGTAWVRTHDATERCTATAWVRHADRYSALDPWIGGPNQSSAYRGRPEDQSFPYPRAAEPPR